MIQDISGKWPGQTQQKYGTYCVPKIHYIGKQVYSTASQNTILCSGGKNLEKGSDNNFP